MHIRRRLLHALLTVSIATLASCAEDSDLPDENSGLEWAEQNLRSHAFQFERGPTFHIDGEDYFLKGPLEDGTRDIPGHEWRQLYGGWFVGRHFNTGPFGMPSWWSSDAEDGQLLYFVIGKIDTWSESKAAWYAAHGFSHYHKFITVDDKTPHPSKVAWFKHIAVDSFNLDGGSKPWLAHEVSPGVDYDFAPNHHYAYPPREEFLYVGCVDQGGESPDFVAVVGADPEDPETYSQIIHRTDLPGIGDEIHHYGTNIRQTRLLVPGLFSGRMHSLNIEDDPRHPFVESFHDNLTPDSGYTVPHTVIGMPDGGYVVTMIGSNTATTAPGGMVRLDADANFVAPFGPPADRDPELTPPRYMYDVGFNMLRGTMVTTSFGLPADVAPGITVDGLGTDIYVWDMATQQVTQVEDIGPGTGALEVRWLHEPGSTIGYTNAPGTSEIWMWEDEDLDGTYAFSLAIALPEGSIPTDILLSEDDKFLYISNWVGNNVMQYDITDPFNPLYVDQVTIPSSQMMRLSPDNRRLYVTNSLLSTWDDTEFPAGVTRNTDYGIYLVNIDHEDGGMEVDDEFFVDLDNVQKLNDVGPARPHQVFFDPGIPKAFGAH